MPGILPMKVIKVGGGSSQSRVAQACDRCRSKKIRCDGVRPCCSQCANVGFECKTSDKLSRRAFPRGYTESLEDRVRSLEAEVHELKCLLDEKDEKIDVLSRLHSMAPGSKKPPSPASTKAPSVSSSCTTGEESTSQSTTERDDLIHVQHSSSLLRKPTQDRPFCGPSSTGAFIDAFAHKLESVGKSSATISADALLTPPQSSVVWQPDSTPKTPPRLVSDQLLNIFFQEWAPLYPVVHRPAILKLYSRYTSNPESIEDDRYGLAQLNLIFGIAAISSTSRVPQDPAFFEHNWFLTLEALSHDTSLSALQCYVLAQIYYSVKSDYKSVLRYRGIAVAICLQLGLHQSQKRFSFNPLMNETRKKVFWSQYVLDRFTAAFTGLPVLISESDICTEYPTDIDDENVTETGFVPTLPDETTRLSSALALFGASRILNKALEELYPSPAGYKLSLSAVHSLAEELDDWQKKLPSHLRLDFAQDKPSTSTTGSRSPLLSVIYYFIRTLIRRPAVCFAQSGTSSPSILSLVDSAKHIIQLLKLLEERRMSLSISVSKRELVFISGLGLLWQNMDLNPDSKLVKEGQKLLSSAFTLLECEAAETAANFAALVNTVTGLEEGARRSSGEGDRSSQAAGQQSKSKSPEKLRVRVPNSQDADVSQDLRRASHSTAMAASASDLPSTVQSHTSLSASSDQSFHTSAIPLTATDPYPPSDHPKLDFLQLGNCKSEWENILSDIESGHSNIYNGIYGGSECGEPPAAFAALNSAAPHYVHPSQPHHQQQGRQQQQLPPRHYHQQHAVSSNLPPVPTASSVGDTDDWSSEDWPDIGLRSTPTMLNGMVAYSDDDLSQGGVDSIPYNPHHVHHTHHTHHHQSSQNDPDHVGALMIPQTLDSLDGTADFSSSSPDGSWVPQCVI